MDFKTSVKTVFNKYATFSGRASRSEYWYFTLLNIIVSWGALLIGAVIGFMSGGTDGVLAGYGIGYIVSMIYGLAVLLPSLAVCVRRLHDTGRGGGWIFIALVPLIGVIILLVFMVIDSEQDNNRFGSKPE